MSFHAPALTTPPRSSDVCSGRHVFGWITGVHNKGSGQYHTCGQISGRIVKVSAELKPTRTVGYSSAFATFEHPDHPARQALSPQTPNRAGTVGDNCAVDGTSAART